MVPFLATKSLGRKSTKCPDSRDILVVLFLCPLVEGFPFWEPEPLNPQNPDFQGWDAQNLSVIGSRVIVNLSSFYSLALGPKYSIYGGHSTI